MVRAPRRRQSRRGPWLVAVALLLTAIVLVVAAATNRSSEPDTRLAYLDDVQSIVQRSMADGLEVVDARNRAAEVGRNDVERRLAQLQDDGQELLKQAERLTPPDKWVAAHGLLLTALSTRSTATASLSKVLSSIADASAPVAVGAAPPASIDPLPALTAVGQDLAVGDRAYQLYKEQLGVDGRPLPDSRWVPDPVPWQQAALTSFVDQLKGSPLFAPNHDVKLVTIGFSPTPVGTFGDLSILPPTRRLTLTVVVQNTGNLPERDVPVEAYYIPAGVPNNVPTDTAKQTVNLAPGQSRSLTLGPMTVVQGQALVGARIGAPDVGIEGEGAAKAQDNAVGRGILIR